MSVKIGKVPTTKVLKLVSYTTANLPTGTNLNPSIAWDSTTGTVKRYNGTNWTNIGVSGSAGTLDDSYDSGGAGAGRTITVDAGALTLTGSVQVVLAITQSDNFGGMTINKAGAGAGALIALTNSGTGNDITGNAGNWLVTAAGNATFVDVAATTLTAATVRSAASGAVNLAVDASTTGTITLGGTSTGAITLGRATSLSSTLAVTGATTLNAGLTQSGGNVSSTVSATTGDGVLIDGSTVTTGNVFRIEYDAALAGAGFGAISVTEDGSEVWVVGEDGNTTIAGTALGTNALTLTTGDLTVTDGNVNITTSTASAADIVDITRGNSATNGHAIDIAMGTAAIAGNALNINFGNGASTGHAIALTYSGANTGDALNLNMTSNVAGGALVVTGAGTRTDRLVSLTDSSGAAGAETVFIQKTAGAASMILLDNNGVAGSDTLEIDHDGNVTGRGIYIHGAAWTGTASEGLLDIQTSGTSISAGKGIVLNLANTGQHAAAIDGSALDITDAATAPGAGTSYAVRIGATNIEALHVDVGQSLFDELVTLDGGGHLNDNDGLTIGNVSGTPDLKIFSDATNTIVNVASGAMKVGDADGTTNYTQFANATGAITFVGTARPTKSEFIPYNVFTSHSGTPAIAQVGAGIVRGWALDADGDEAIVCTFRVPDNIVAGSTATAYIYWAANAVANDCRLDLTTLAVSESGALAGAGTTNSVTDTTDGTANDLNITAGITTAALTAGQLLAVQVNRDANHAADTLAVDAVIVGVRIDYSAGSV